MRSFSSIWTVVVAVSGLLMMAGANGQHQHAHDTTNASKQQALVKPAKKWETDAALRQGMNGIRHALIASQTAIHQDRLSSAEYRKLAESVEKELGHIVKNCKLAPEADAALHDTVLLDLIRSSELMRTSNDKSIQRHNAMQILNSLRIYGEHFNHAGWEMTTHSH